jgi:hypothetical protein
MSSTPHSPEPSPTTSRAHPYLPHVATSERRDRDPAALSLTFSRSGSPDASQTPLSRRLEPDREQRELQMTVRFCARSLGPLAGACRHHGRWRVISVPPPGLIGTRETVSSPTLGCNGLQSGCTDATGPGQK